MTLNSAWTHICGGILADGARCPWRIDGAPTQEVAEGEYRGHLASVSHSFPNQFDVESRQEMVDHPDHYGGKDNPYEVIKVIEAWKLGFLLGNAVKYIARAGKKDKSKEIEDLRKAQQYIGFEIARLERE